MKFHRLLIQSSHRIAAATMLGSIGLAQSFVVNTADIPSGSPFNNSDTENVDFGDVDGDGDWDAAFAEGGENTPQANRLWLNQGPGAQLGVFVDVTATHMPAINDSSRDVEFADIDSDGDLDLYVANHSSLINQPSRWWVNAGNGSYSDETSTRWLGLGTAGSSVHPALVLGSGGFIDWSGDGDFADLDNDGDLDLFHSSYGSVFSGNVPSRIFLNDSLGFFSEFNPSGFTPAGSGIQNGDPGIWCEGTQQANTTNATGMFCDIASSAADIDLGDMDGDFDIDILHGAIFTAPRAFHNRLTENGGVLGFRDVTGAVFPSGYSSGNGHYEQEMGDLDGDGDLDIFGLNWTSTGGYGDTTLENTGSGTYANSTILPGSGADDEEGDFIDFDNDGDLDIFVANFSGQDRLYQNTNNGGTSFSFLNVTSPTLPILSGTSKDGESCDVDGDGDYDIFLANSFGQANVYLENTSQVPDQFPPYLPNLEQAPNRIAGPTPTVIRVHVYDNAPYYTNWYNQTTLTYSVDNGAPQVVNMKSSAGQIFRGEISGALTGSISYFVTSMDEYGNSGVSASKVYLANSLGQAGTPICFGDGSGTACPCGNTGQTGAGCANSTGSGATLASFGSDSIALGNLQLSASGTVPNNFGVFFQGGLSAFGGPGVPWGDGHLCAGGNLIRLETVFTSVSGTVSSSVNIAAVGGAFVGQTRVYQLVYRDPSGSPCGAGFNSTGAILLTWMP